MPKQVDNVTTFQLGVQKWGNNVKCYWGKSNKTEGIFQQKIQHLSNTIIIVHDVLQEFGVNMRL